MKKILTIFFFCSCCYSSWSQTPKELLSQFNKLYEKADYTNALPVLEKLMDTVRKEKGEENLDYANLLSNLGTVHLKMSSYSKALVPYLRAAGIRKKLLGELSSPYGESLENLAYLYEKTGNAAMRIKVLDNLVYLYSRTKNNEKLETTYQKILINIKTASGEDSLYTTYLDRLAIFYYDTGNEEKEQKLYEEGIIIKKKIFGENNKSYVFSLNSLAMLYKGQGNYSKAVPLLLQVAEIRKFLFGEFSEPHLKVIMNLGESYERLGGYVKAEETNLQSISIAKRIFGEWNSVYSQAITNLAVFYNIMGQYKKAEPLFLQAIEIEKKLNPGSGSHITAMDNLASLYVDMEQYGKAEQLILLAKEMNEKTNGRKNEQQAILLDHQAGLFKQLGQHDKSLSLLLEACEIAKETSGAESIAYATILNNTSVIYTAKRDFKKAGEYVSKSLEIIKKIYGEEHMETSSGLFNLGMNYSNLGEFAQAEPLFERALAIRKKIAGDNNPATARMYDALATVYKETGYYKKAEQAYLKAISILKTSFGEMSSGYTRQLSDVGQFYIETREYVKAEEYFLKNAANITRQALSDFALLSDKEKSIYIKNNIWVLENFNSLLYNYRQASPEFRKTNYDLLLLLKSLSLADTKSMVETIRNSNDAVLKNDFEKWQSNKTLLSKQYSLPVERRNGNVPELETQTEDLEKKLNRSSSQFRDQQKSLRITMNEVKQKLQPGEASIEFVRFLLYNKGWTDSILYAASIIRYGEPLPVFVPLCEERQLQKLFDSAGTTATAMVNSFYRGFKVENKNAATLGKELYQLVWQPLEAHLKGINKIAYSPAGKLYSIAFHALPVDSNTVLMDKYKLQQYTSTRQLVLQESEKQTVQPKSITLFGDANFSMDSTALAKNKTNNENHSSNIYTAQNRGTRGNTWSDLPGTAQEVNAIQSLFEKNKTITKVYTQAAASEENLKALSGNSPQILHVATHGFFLPEADKDREANSLNEENSYSLADDPLLRSGLILAGGNYAWSGKPAVDGVEDGIVTAYEISQLNLSNTELVVLSACETALGDVKGSDGVFGLQRAFKMAGVKKMIVSLWQVPDKETAELMTGFYSYWIKGKTIEEAFSQAQGDMRKKYSPFYWAAFVLVE